MKWNIAAKVKYPERWFAWRPVYLRKERKMVWWEWIYRSWHQACDQGFYEYGQESSDFDSKGFLE